MAKNDAGSRDDRNDPGRAVTIAKIVSLLVMLTCYLSAALTVYAYQRPEFATTIFGLTASVVANVGVFAAIVAAVLVYILQRLQGGAYWFSWLQIAKVQLDERRQLRRLKVFQRAYGLGVVVAWLLFLYGNSWIRLSYSASARDSMAEALSWLFIILLLGLPSIIGAWAKGDR